MRTFLIARRAIRFYATCIEWAAKGTLDRANGWYWLIGFGLIAAVGWHLGFGVLRFPEDWPHFIVGAVTALAVTWLVIFLARLFAAPGKLYGDALDEISTLIDEATPKINVFLSKQDGGVQTVRTKLKEMPPIWGPSSKWVQIRVRGSESASLVDCEAHVTRIQRLKTGQPPKELLSEQTFCNWSQMAGEELKRVTIPGLVEQVANVFSIHDVAKPILGLEFYHRKYQLEDEMQKPGQYAIEIVVTASNSKSVQKSFLFDWDGTFNNISFKLNELEA